MKKGQLSLTLWITGRRGRTWTLNPWFVVDLWVKSAIIIKELRHGGLASLPYWASLSRTDLRDSPRGQLLDQTGPPAHARSCCLSRRYLSLDSRGRMAFDCTQIVRCLQIQPGLRRIAEIPRQPQRRVRRYATLAVNDVVDACRRNANCMGQRVSRHSQGYHNRYHAHSGIGGIPLEDRIG